MKLKTADDLRDYLLESIEKTSSGKMDIEELSILSKASEAIFSSVRTQLMYNNMRNEIPNIPFLQVCNKGEKITIKQNNIKVIPSKNDKEN